MLPREQRLLHALGHRCVEQTEFRPLHLAALAWAYGALKFSDATVLADISAKGIEPCVPYARPSGTEAAAGAPRSGQTPKHAVVRAIARGVDATLGIRRAFVASASLRRSDAGKCDEGAPAEMPRKVNFLLSEESEVAHHATPQLPQATSSPPRALAGLSLALW
eukprot:s625_g29.t1